MSRPVPHNLRSDDGFTLVELLVAMTLSIIVLFATLLAFDTFSSATARHSRVSGTNEEVRATVDRVVNELRGASAIARAEADDLVYSVRASPTITRTTRLCVSPAPSRALYESRSTTWATGTTLPSTCPTPTSEAGWTTTRPSAASWTTATLDGLFSYDGASSAPDPSKVKAVGLTVGLDTSSGGRATSSTLRASAAIRRTAGASTALAGVGSDDIQIVCPPDAPPRVHLAADVLGLLGPVTVTYAELGGTVIGAVAGPASVALSTSLTTLVTTITDSLGVTKTITKPVGCQS
jgi:type II secretory pathway pseudopilin PulG